MTEHKDVTGLEILQIIDDVNHGGLSFGNMVFVEEHLKVVHHISDLKSPEALVYRARHYRALLLGELNSLDLELSLKGNK